MPKLTLTNITGGFNAPARINSNNDLVEAAIENTLSRDGTGPNQMEAPFDMNGYRIINVGSPQNPTDAARLVDITGLITLTEIPVPSLAGNAGKILYTNGTALFWGNIPVNALPVFTETANGAVSAPGSGVDERALWADGTWETPAIKANYAQTTTDNTWDGAQRVPMVDVNVTSTTDIDVSLSNSYSLLLDMNTTLTFSGEEAGAKFRLWITQDGTGGRAITWPAVTWAAGSAPVLSTTAGSTNWVDLEYDGTTWYGAWDQTGGGGTGGPDPGEYDLVFDASEKNVDLFRRLGSPVSPQTWEVAISPGVVIHSDSILEESLNLGGAFPSGTIINILNQGYVIGKGGRGASAIGAQKHGDAAYSFGNNKPTAGGNAIKGPATGVTVNINNGNGYVWGGGGGGGAGAINCRNDGGGIGGAGGGGAGGGEGGLGGYLRLRGNTYGASVVDAANGRLNLDGTAAGGAGSNGAGVDADGDTDDYSVGNGGAGGDYGSAGAAGGAGTPFTGSGAMDIPATAGGAAGRAVTAGYAGTLTFTSGGTSPNVKGSV